MTFGERLDEHIRYLLHGHRSASERDRVMGRFLGLDGQTIEKYRRGERAPRSIPDLIALADKLGVTLDWLTGRTIEPRWSTEVQQVRIWLSDQLHAVHGTDYVQRTIAVIELIKPRLSLAQQDWFLAGILGMPLEDYRAMLQLGPKAELSKESAGRFAVWLDLSTDWLYHGMVNSKR